MIKKMGIDWNLRLRMAEQGLSSTTELVPLLAERGVHLSREQVYRLVTNTRNGSAPMFWARYATFSLVLRMT